MSNILKEIKINNKRKIPNRTKTPGFSGFEYNVTYIFEDGSNQNWNICQEELDQHRQNSVSIIN